MELNFFTYFEPTYFKDVISHDAWKESMRKEYDSLIKNKTCKLIYHPYKINQ